MNLRNRVLRKLNLRRGFGFHVNDYLPIFSHNSAMNGFFDRNISLEEYFTFSSAENFPLQLLRLIGDKNGELISRRSDEYEQTDSTKELGKLFDLYGSDKNGHNYCSHVYTSYYADVINNLRDTRKGQELNILEIGLGTNNTDTASHMGENGKPGASLRAFRDFCPEANVYGADIDKRILFKEDRIKTAFVDQLKPETFNQMIDQLGGVKEFDLIIDDGLHTTHANINTLLFAMDSIKVGGFIAIEDIQTRTIPAWQVIDKLIDKSRFKSFVFYADDGNIYSLQRIS